MRSKNYYLYKIVVVILYLTTIFLLYIAESACTTTK